MKLAYYEGRNFGDALNPYLFERLLPEGFLDEDGTELLLGIGTILSVNRCPPSASTIHVFSSGCAPDQAEVYGSLPMLDERFVVHCVRGPLTAQALNLPPEAAVADGAYLLRATETAGWTSKGDIALVPHHRSMQLCDHWDMVAEMAGLRLVDPRRPISEVLGAIKASKLVLCEAMHGAIVADALRVPWIPFRSLPHINLFKWRDFCTSMDLPCSLRDVTPPPSERALGEAIKAHRSTFVRAASRSSLILRAARGVMRRKHASLTARQLLALVSSRPSLSTDALCEDRTRCLLERLDRLVSLRLNSTTIGRREDGGA